VWWLGTGQVPVAKNCQKPTLWRHSQKKTQNQKIVFHCRLKDLPSLLRVWTALVQLAKDLCGWKTTEISLVFSQFPSTIYLQTGSHSVKCLYKSTHKTVCIVLKWFRKHFHVKSYLSHCYEEKFYEYQSCIKSYALCGFSTSSQKVLVCRTSSNELCCRGNDLNVCCYVKILHIYLKS